MDLSTHIWSKANTGEKYRWERWMIDGPKRSNEGDAF